MTSEIKPRPDANHECDPDCPYQDVGIADDGCPDGCGTDKYCSPALRARVAELEAQLAAVREYDPASAITAHVSTYYGDHGTTDESWEALCKLADELRALTSGGTGSEGGE